MFCSRRSVPEHCSQQPGIIVPYYTHGDETQNAGLTYSPIKKSDIDPALPSKVKIAIFKLHLISLMDAGCPVD